MQLILKKKMKATPNQPIKLYRFSNSLIVAAWFYWIFAISIDWAREVTKKSRRIS